MFADDTNITVPGCTFAELEQATNSELNNLYNGLKANKLSLYSPYQKIKGTSPVKARYRDSCGGDVNSLFLSGFCQMLE